MQGQLGKQLFADLIRDLSRENAAGRLRITREGETIEVSFESGVPMAATSTHPDEQIECRLVRDGLVDAEQIKAAWLGASESSRPIDAVLVEGGALAAETLQQAQKALSLGIINTAFEWYSGDYEFTAESSALPGARLTWTAAECILNGARHASSIDTILDVLAPDYKIVCPAAESAGSMEQSATLSSVEGYVLSCIQSPVTVWEASSATGLSYIETRRAIFVLILLGLLVEQQDASGHVAPEQQHTKSQIRVEDPTLPVEWCPVEDASGDGRAQQECADPADFGPTSEPEDNVEYAGAEGQREGECRNPAAIDPIGDTFSKTLASEEALYQQRLFLEERLPEASADGDRAVADQSKNGNRKSLATAIQELNIRLRLAARSVTDQRYAHGDQAPVEENGDSLIEQSPGVEEPPFPGERLRAGEELKAEAALRRQAAIPAESALGAAPNVGAEEWPTLEEWPMLQAPPTFEEPLRLGPQPGAETPLPPVEAWVPGAEASMPRVEAPMRAEEPASLPRRDNGSDERLLKKIIGTLDARLSIAATSDYYQLLGVDRLASNGSITKSYEEMIALYDGYKARWPEAGELESRITELMGKIGRAYETLGNVERRRVYDMPPVKDAQRPSAEGESTAARRRDASPAHKERRQPADIERARDSRKTRPDRKKPAPLPVPDLAGKSERAAASQREADGSEPDLRNPYEAAEEYYKRGRALYERSDLHTAAHLLREAIKLDANRSSYHYQLGLVLSTLSQARKEHKHHKGCHVTCRLGGLLARNQKVRREAERHLLKATELDPSNPEIKLKLGLLYKDAALDQKSQRYFYEAFMLDANSELARLELGLDREPQTSPAIEPVKKRAKRRSSRE